MKKITVKKVLVLFLCLPLVFTAFACNKSGNQNQGGADGPGEIEFWTTYGTEKVLRNRTDLYDDIKLGDTVFVESCKGESESAQVIMTAKSRVKEYNAEIVSDLVSDTGATFSKANVELRHQKYVQVSTIYSSYNNPPLGWYPDALLPLETAVKFKENHIEADENQGLYVTFHVPANQVAGEYSGQLKITYDGKEKNLPIRLTVYDLTISEVTHSMSYFNLGFSWYFGELDCSKDLWRKYAEALLKYRISPSSVMTGISTTTDADIETYVDEVYDLVSNYGMSTINSLWKNGANLTKFLYALAKKSVEVGENLIAKTVVKGPDEPTASTMGTVTSFMELFDSGIANAKKEIDSLVLLGADQDFVNELKASVDAIPAIITVSFRNDITENANVDTYCPTYDIYDTEENRRLYDDQWKGLWWYGCMAPRPPYPTYHTEDTLISARSVSWMMSEYDVIGNLYWCATIYARYGGGTYQPIEDIYNGNAEHYHYTNGDGYLFYPAAPYSLDEPVASMRLEAIGDGNEDYELLYAVKAAYKQAGKDFAPVQRYISDLIYSGTRVKFDNISEQFATARRAMIKLAIMANAGIFINDVSDDGKGTVNFEVFAGSGSVVYNGSSAIDGTADNGMMRYDVSVKLEDDANSIALRVQVGGKEYSFDFGLGGKALYYGADEFFNSNNTFSDGNATVTAERVGDKIRLDIGAVSEKYQSIRYTSSIFGSLDKNSKKLLVYVENDGDETPLRWLVRLERATLNAELYNGTLAHGTNVLEIDLAFIDFEKNGKIIYSDMFFSLSPGDYDAKTIYIEGITAYWK